MSDNTPMWLTEVIECWKSCPAMRRYTIPEEWSPNVLDGPAYWVAEGLHNYGWSAYDIAERIWELEYLLKII